MYVFSRVQEPNICNLRMSNGQVNSEYYCLRRICQAVCQQMHLYILICKREIQDNIDYNMKIQFHVLKMKQQQKQQVLFVDCPTTDG